MADADPRLTPARGDIAARELQGIVTADRYVDGTDMQVSASVLPIRKTPAPDGPQETQALFGEVFKVYDERDGFAWGQAAYDGYVGYVDVAGLSAPVLPVTHRVSALRTYLFSEPDLKSAPLGLISKNARVAGKKREGSYLQDARGGWVWAGHTVKVTEEGGDPVTHAEAYIGSPYFWGGRESLGLDCSGLVQNAWGATGQVIPRDADLQETFFARPENGEVIWTPDLDGNWQDVALRRGDLIFWPGHVGIMADPETMLHANATHMATTLDGLTEIAALWSREKSLEVRTIVRPG